MTKNPGTPAACTCKCSPHKLGCPQYPKRCPKCKRGERELGATCPYAADICGENDACSCCDDCQYRCAQDR